MLVGGRVVSRAGNGPGSGKCFGPAHTTFL